MTFLRNHARLAALVLGGLFIAGCDSRLPTSPGGGTGGDPSDLTPPRITFALSAGTNNVVDLGAPLTVVVTATDDNGVQTLNTTLNNGATVIGADTSTLKPTQASTSRTIKVPMSGRKDGDMIVIRSTASDASLNFNTDSIIVTVADTVAPKMTLSSKAIANNSQMQGGDSLDIQVTASDSSGMRWAGYRVFRLGGPDSNTVVFGDSVAGAAGASTMSGTFGKRFDLAMNIGTYRVVGFAVDNSGRITNPGPKLDFTIRDGEAPTLTFVAPTTGATVNVGDPLFVRVNLHDNVGLKSAKFYAVSPRGDIALGTADTVMRYDTVAAPQGGASFRSGLTDTTDIRRFLAVRQPVDQLPGKLLVYGIVTDAAGNVTRDTVVVQMTKGPNVTLNAPIQGDSLTRGTKLRISVSATSGVGVVKLGFDVRSGTSGPAWPTPVIATYDTSIASSPLNVGPYVVDIDIPPDAPSKGVLTIAPHATDINAQPGAPTPQDFFVRVGAAPPPLVRQSISARVELTDTVTVYASGAALTQVGYVIRDVLNPNTRVDSNAVSASSSSFGPKGITFNIATKWQGKRVSISAFARDSAGNVGWAVPAGVNTPITDTTKMARDTALIVFGRTYALPASRKGVIADVVVDRARGNVFLSNIGASRLEVWQEGNKAFDANGIFVGSQPWGMTMSRTAPASDTMYVANSGGTNLSRVYIGAPTPSGMKEDLAHRILTRISLLYKVTESRDATTGRIRITVTGPLLFSDRPQYVQQAAGPNGRIYLSTKPTAASGLKGTIRYLDSKAQAPDQRFILAFGSQGSSPNSWLVANVDGAGVSIAPADSNTNDVLTICDHASGSLDNATCVSSSGGVASALDSLHTYVPATDVEAEPNLDENSLGLTDTTYAAASGDGKWIAFGEGHRSPYSRAFLLHDDGSNPDRYDYASPSINVEDLINNASDQIFGLALSKTGKTLGLHGSESYFAAVSEPFTQRLQGKFSTFGSGAGIALHPEADDMLTTPVDSRLAFIASSNGTIEMVDIGYYTSRGTLATKANLYGPLRASLPFPGDDPSVVLKLFGLSANGLVVIDVTAADIQAGP